MNGLRELQSDLQAALLDNEIRRAAKWLVPGAHAPAREGFDTYAYGYRARLIEVLENDFEHTARTLGYEQFEQIANRYLDVHPSRSRSLRDFGRQFANWLMEQQVTPLVTELARFEWALTDAFDARDAAALTNSALAAVPAEGWAYLTFSFHPSVQLGTCAWNTLETYRAQRDDLPVPPTARLAEPIKWIIWRDDLRVCFDGLTAEEAELIALARQGGCFAELCTALAARRGADDAPPTAVNYLKRWLANGWLV